jgi:hypothetical protein
LANDNREIPRRSPTNDEINAAKTHDPNSVANKDRRGASKDLNRPALESAGQDEP